MFFCRCVLQDLQQRRTSGEVLTPSPGRRRRPREQEDAFLEPLARATASSNMTSARFAAARQKAVGGGVDRDRRRSVKPRYVSSCGVSQLAVLERTEDRRAAVMCKPLISTSNGRDLCKAAADKVVERLASRLSRLFEPESAHLHADYERASARPEQLRRRCSRRANKRLTL
ncbi:hypothetical protein MRX96_011261 [Rhipicephalus microplus]